MIGSDKQIAWAEKIRNDLSQKWNNAINNLVLQGISEEFEKTLTEIYVTACAQQDASIWIDNQSGKMYTIANHGKQIGGFRKRFEWSIEMEQKIGFETIDKILDYDV